MLFQSWMYQLNGIDSKRRFGVSISWKKRYVIIQRVGDTPFLCYYEKKPKYVTQKPKGN